MIKFTVYGKAAAAGSKRGFVRGGRALIVDASKASRPWKKKVAEDALDVMRIDGGDELRPPLEGPLCVDMTFYMPRPKAHFGTGRNAAVLKPTAPLYPTKIPDRGKLARGVEDALSGIVYKDDAQIVDGVIQKRWTTDRERVEITITEMTAQSEENVTDAPLRTT